MKWTTRVEFVEPILEHAPAMIRDSLHQLVMTAHTKHGGYVTVTVTTPRKPRSTGPESQNNHAHGHAQQLAEYTGHDIDEILTAAKFRAIKRGYPFDTIGGQIVPWSQARISTVECKHLIDELHQIADELDFVLEES